MNGSCQCVCAVWGIDKVFVLQVVRVSMDGGRDGPRARGVVFHRDGALHKLRARKEVILCAGAIQSPHLLLLSGVGPRKHLEEVGEATLSVYTPRSRGFQYQIQESSLTWHPFLTG